MKSPGNRFLFSISMLILLFLFFSESCINRQLIHTSQKNNSDTIDGYFLYECNIPYQTFSRLDQVENSNNIVYFGKIDKQSDIEKLYNKGVFFFLFGHEIVEYINESNTFLSQNKKSIQKFDSAINYVKYLFDTSYNATLFYDRKKILSYKKVYLKFSYKNLGKRDLLIPDISNYQCCYSNKKISANCYFITDIIDFKIF